MPRVTTRIAAAEFHRERNMSARSATRRRPPGIRNGPAKVIRMPTPTVVRRRRAIKAGLGLLVLSILAAIIARLYLRHIAPPSPEKVSGLTGNETEILGVANQQRARAANLIFARFTETGVGIAQSADGNTYAAQDLLR
jgi:hypothetical protein